MADAIQGKCPLIRELLNHKLQKMGVPAHICCGRAIWMATPSAAALSHAEMQAFRRNARFARYSRGNRLRLRLSLAS